MHDDFHMTLNSESQQKKQPKPLLDFTDTEPWFVPKQIWTYWALYYPVTWHGWAVIILIFAPLVVIFLLFAATGVSWVLVVARFLPFLLIGLIIFNATTLKRGQWPSWWKRRKQ